MKKSDSKNSDSQQVPSIWARQLPLETETCFFILANTLDVCLTYMLLNQGPQFQESNWIANFILSQYGFKGMIYFKFALVAMVTVIAQIVARTRPRTARLLLNGGTALVGLVVAYSCYLWVRHTGYFG